MEKYAPTLEFPPEEINCIKEASALFSAASTASTNSAKEETASKTSTIISLPPSANPEKKTLILDLDETLIKVSNESANLPDFSFYL